MDNRLTDLKITVNAYQLVCSYNQPVC